MKDSRLKGIIALAVVTVLAFGVIYGSKIMVKDTENGEDKEAEQVEGAIDVTGKEGITAAREIKENGTLTGYSVTAQATGFNQNYPITLEVFFETDAKTIKEVALVSHGETPGYGAKMEENNYLGQFAGITAPVYLKGTAPAASDEADAAEEKAVETTAQTTAAEGLKDGVYRVESETADNGYIYSLTLKVENGEITSVVWDGVNEVGEYKSYLSSVGEYVMTEDGPTWKEQADALAAFVLENQSTEGITMDDNGKTDAVASVSISVDGFVELTEKALVMAASGEGAAEEAPEGETNEEAPADNGEVSEIDAISGATMTSNALVQLINNAYDFISAYAGK